MSSRAVQSTHSLRVVGVGPLHNHWGGRLSVPLASGPPSPPPIPPPPIPQPPGARAIAPTVPTC